MGRAVMSFTDSAPRQKTYAPGRIERALVIAGAVVDISITARVWRSAGSYQGMWPLPALYFIDVAAVGVLSALAFTEGHPAGRYLLWGAVGILGAFSFLGMFSVGLLYVPIVLLFAGAAVLSETQESRHLLGRLVVCLVGAAFQAGLMLAVVRWLE